MPYYIGSNCAGFTVLQYQHHYHNTSLAVESQIRKSMGSKLPEFGFPALCSCHEMAKKIFVFQKAKSSLFFLTHSIVKLSRSFQFQLWVRQTTEHETGLQNRKVVKKELLNSGSTKKSKAFWSAESNELRFSLRNICISR